MIKVIIIIFATALTLMITAGIFIGNYLYKLIINAHTDKSAFLGPKNKSPDTKNNDIISNWILNHTESKFIHSFDNLKLHYYITESRTESNKWVILCHGYNGNALRMNDSAMYFYNMGYNLLIPDARGHGKSSGDYIGMGFHDRLDIANYVDKILKIDKNANITLYGCSMGASTILMCCGEKLPDNVKVAIADCGYSSAWTELAYQLRKYLYLPSFPLLHFMSIMTKINAGYKIAEADAVCAVKKSNIPTLFIHGSNDTFVPTYMVDVLYDAAKCPKEKLIVKGAEHVKSAKVNPRLYWDTIYDFLEKYSNTNK